MQYDQGGRGEGHRGGGGYRGGHGYQGGGREGGGFRGHRPGVPLADLDPALTDVSRRVIGCAIEVHKTLGPGYDESVYQGALEAELKKEGIAFKSGHAFGVSYKGTTVGQTVADLFIADRFLVEVMAEAVEIGYAERMHLRAQLKAADLELGLIINFGSKRLKDGLVRVLNPEKLGLKRPGEEEGHEEEVSGNVVDFEGGQH